MHPKVDQTITHLYPDIYDSPDPTGREKHWNLIIKYIEWLEDLVTRVEKAHLKRYGNVKEHIYEMFDTEVD